MSLPKPCAILVSLCLVLLLWSATGLAKQKVAAVGVSQLPEIDGVADDPAWGAAPTITTRDKIADIDIRLKAVHGAGRICFLVQYPDPDESRLHKPWTWNPDIEIYEAGKAREDTFVIKWAMGADDTNLSVYADQPHHADVWFWKANRTDPMGVADDKFQLLSASKSAKSYAVTSTGGRAMHLQRVGDAGSPAYATHLLVDYAGDTLPQYRHRPPTGSRGDIRAKGLWKNGQWTIEWSRALVTGHEDDVQFDPSRAYLFGVSRYEVAARPMDPSLSQPLYGSGDVGEALLLHFEP